MEQMKSMGPLDQILGMIPGLNSKKLAGLSIDERKIAQTEAIIKSMTIEERENPSIINSSRKKRIAAGSGTKVQDVNSLIKQFEQMQAMIKMMQKGKGKMGRIRFPFA